VVVDHWKIFCAGLMEEHMWRKPTMTEIRTGAEINSYVSAKK